LGVEPLKLETRRRAGELVAVREDGTYVYPSWQFGPDAQPLPWLPRLTAAAREAGLDDDRLDALMSRRIGLTSDRRLVDAVRAGEEESVLRAVRAAGAGR
jgi:hypothetical protein